MRFLVVLLGETKGAVIGAVTGGAGAAVYHYKIRDRTEGTKSSTIERAWSSIEKSADLDGGPDVKGRAHRAQYLLSDM